MKTPYDVIIAPVRTEKSFMNVSENKYTFIVARGANKTEIRIALEAIFGVKVEKVNTQIYEGKLKRQGRTQGYRPTTKRAIVKLTADSKKIDFFEGMA